MKRDLYHDLLAWKASDGRKPLLLRGARQTGKTHLLCTFGRSEYESIAYCNFEEDPGLSGLFDRDLDPLRIVSDLSVYLDLRIRPKSDLIVFDEIQASSRALTSLKYFLEKAPDHHVVAAGSLLGIKGSVPGSFPVGKVSFLDLHPMSFLEFLDAMEASRYRKMLEELTSFTPLNEAFHRELKTLLTKYQFLGGMPEVVDRFADKGSPGEARKIQLDIIDSYVLDFAKHAPGPDIPRLTQVWDSIPRHLARQNKKFVFSAVRKGARAREYENALTWLEDAGLIHRCRAVKTARVPLRHYADDGCYKVYPLDVGLLGAMARTPLELLAQGDRLFNEYEGAFIESYVAQQIVAHFRNDLYYWRSKGGKAELDFLLECRGRSYPLEVKAGVNPRSKSLRSYDDQFAPPLLARTNLLNLRRDGKTCNVPLYAVSQLSRLLAS